MNGGPVTSIGLLGLQAVVVAGIVLLLLRLRHRLGLGLLYIFVGSNQYLQTVLSSTLYLELPGDVLVSPGSVVLFSSSLFAILLVYLLEDIPRTRTLIYGVVLANITLTLLTWITGWQLSALPTRNLLGVPQALFQVDVRIFLAGTLTLLLDAFLIVVVYEALLFKARRLPRPMRLITTFVTVLVFDSLLFTTLSFAGTEAYGDILRSQLLGKSAAGLLFGLALWAVAMRPSLAGGRTGPPLESEPRRDIFAILTYRERYEYVRRRLALSEAQSRAKSTFLAHVSHELRTPLNAVLGFTRVLLRNRARHLDEEELGYLERVHRNGKHLLQLINGLIDLSRIEAGRIELESTEVSINDTIQQTLGELQGQVLGSRVELVGELPPFDVELETDPARLKQVLINLVGNAVKFTREGTITVRLRADASTQRAERIEVIDTGVGIEPGELERIFQPFEQVDGDAAQGAGLGLAISRALCEQLGLRLEVSSRVGEGSVFSLVCPGGEDGS